MNNSNQESTSFIYKKILSQLISFIEGTISVTKENYIVSHLCNDIFTLVERSFHLRGTIVSLRWNGIIYTWKRLNYINFRKNM